MGRFTLAWSRETRLIQQRLTGSLRSLKLTNAPLLGYFLAFGQLRLDADVVRKNEECYCHILIKIDMEKFITITGPNGEEIDFPENRVTHCPPAHAEGALNANFIKTRKNFDKRGFLGDPNLELDLGGGRVLPHKTSND